MKTPICNPLIPYVGAIYGGKFSPGKSVKIQGIVPNIAYRFNINLQSGPKTIPGPRDDVAIQVSVRLLDGYILLNSLQNGIWGEEQRGSILPINGAEKFEIILLCDFHQYKISINGQHYCEFPQRIHYDDITHLAIDGDVSILQISYTSASLGGTEEALGNGMVTRSQPLAPISVPSVKNDFIGVEGVEASTARAPLLGIHFPPSPGFFKPPCYAAALDASSRPPYPIGSATGMPYAKTGQACTDAFSYPPSCVPGTVPPPFTARTSLNAPAPFNAPIPFNAAAHSSLPSNRPEKRFIFWRWIFEIIGILVIFTIILLVLKHFNLLKPSKGH